MIGSMGEGHSEDTERRGRRNQGKMERNNLGETEIKGEKSSQCLKKKARWKLRRDETTTRKKTALGPRPKRGQSIKERERASPGAERLRARSETTDERERKREGTGMGNRPDRISPDRPPNFSPHPPALPPGVTPPPHHLPLVQFFFQFTTPLPHLPSPSYYHHYQRSSRKRTCARPFSKT